MIIICVLFCVWYLLNESINLGLDLQGGLHLVLQVEAEKRYGENELVQVKDYVSRELKKQRIQFDTMSV